MSYTNGVGALQQVLSSVTPATTQGVDSASNPGRGSTAAANTAGPDRADQTSLSFAGGVIAHALAGSDVRTEKVAALQQAIASGSYSVSSSDVADKMVQSLLE